MALTVAASLAALKLPLRLSSWRLRAFISTLSPVPAALPGISACSANLFEGNSTPITAKRRPALQSWEITIRSLTLLAGSLRKVRRFLSPGALTLVYLLILIGK